MGREVVECDCVAGTCVWVTQGSPPRLYRLNRTNQTAAVVMVVVVIFSLLGSPQSQSHY